MLTKTDSSITFDPETDTYRLHVDWRNDETVTTAVTKGVAAVTDEPPDGLDPLFETIDPDALNRLYDPTDGGSNRPDGRVSFRFNDCAVSVYASGTIEITPAEEDDPTTVRVPRTLRDR